jgi:hypothetical protein
MHYSCIIHFINNACILHYLCFIIVVMNNALINALFMHYS